MDLYKVLMVVILVVALSLLTFLFPSGSVTGMAIGAGGGTSNNFVLIGILMVLAACFVSVHVLVRRS